MLAEADYALTQSAMGNETPNDKPSSIPQFYIAPMKDETRSKEEGRPIYEDREYVRILVPGSRDNMVKLVTDRERAMWPRQYEAFRNGNSQEVLEGTPLEEWPGVTRSEVEELKYFNIRTVEDLVNMSDSNAQKFMGINSLKRKAEAYMAAAEDNAEAEKLASELASRDSDIMTLTETVKELQARLAELEE